MRNQAFFLCTLALATILGLGAAPASADMFGQQSMASPLTDGLWAAKMNRNGKPYILAMQFFADSRFALATFQGERIIAKQDGTYRAENGRLAIKLDNGQSWTYQYRIDGDRLTLASATDKVVFQRIRRQSTGKNGSSRPEVKKGVTADRLQGTWVLQSSGGRIVTRIQGNRIELTVTDEKGEVIGHVAGTFTVSGDKLMVRAENGRRGAVPFRLAGDRLTLVIDSNTFTMTRSKAKPEGLNGFPSIS